MKNIILLFGFLVIVGTQASETCTISSLDPVQNLAVIDVEAVTKKNQCLGL